MSKKSKTTESKSTKRTTNGTGSASFPTHNKECARLPKILFSRNSCQGGAQRYRPSLLEPEILFPGRIWVVKNYFSAHECQEWMDRVSSSTAAMEKIQQRGTKYIAARECFRTQYHDADLAHCLYQRLEQTVPKLGAMLSQQQQDNQPYDDWRPPKERAVSFNPNIRLYRYDKGMQFARHIDESNVVEGMGVTRVTVLIYLSDCQGGATRFFVDHQPDVCFAPVVGAMLLHVHGDECCLEHQGDPVLAGTKWVLRTDVVYSST